MPRFAVFLALAAAGTALWLARELESPRAPDVDLGAPLGSQEGAEEIPPPLLDATVRALDLDPAQRTAFERVVSDTRARLARLLRTPTADGQTWARASLPVPVPPACASGSCDGGGSSAEPERATVPLMAPDHDAMVAFRNARVPGTEETYAEAEQRIAAEGRSRVREILTEEQERNWEAMDADALFGIVPLPPPPFDESSVDDGGGACG